MPTYAQIVHNVFSITETDGQYRYKIVCKNDESDLLKPDNYLGSFIFHVKYEEKDVQFVSINLFWPFLISTLKNIF